MIDFDHIRILKEEAAPPACAVLLAEQGGKDQDALRVEHAREDSLLENPPSGQRFHRTLRQRTTTFAQEGANAQIHEVGGS